MTARCTLVLAVLLGAGCQLKNTQPVTAEPIQPEAANGALNVYQLVIADLLIRESPDSHFVGTKIWVSPDFCEGDSLSLSWGNDFKVDEELVETLKTANVEAGAFPQDELAGSEVRITEIESFHDLHYYGEGSKPVDAKCLVQFWRAGFTVDGTRAIVRFRYGPSFHGAAGTYILERTEAGWRITASKISFYA